jgi:hypothetical protein
MTPEQKQALEGLVDRALTPEELEQIEKWLDPENRNDVEIAALLSVGRTTTAPTEIGVGTILATLGEGGGIFLDGLVAMGSENRNVYWAMELIKAGTFDIGMPATRAQMLGLKAGLPAEAAAVGAAFDALLALAVVPDPLPLDQVSLALNLAEGRMVI